MRVANGFGLCLGLGSLIASGALAQTPISVGVESTIEVPVTTPAESRAGAARRACSATTCLVVWNEPDEDQAEHVHAARFRASDGAPEDGLGFVLDDTDDGQRDPDVVTDGTSFFVVWAVQALGEIHGARVDGATGARVGGVVRVGTASRTWIERPSAAFDGSQYFVAWNASDGGIHGTRVRPADGVVLDPSGVVLVTASDPERFGVAYDGTQYLLAFGRGDTLYGARVRASDAVSLDPSGFPIAVTGSRTAGASVASAGDGRSLVVWSDARASTGPTSQPSDVFGARIEPGGGLPDGNGFRVTGHAAYAIAPQVVFDGARYLVAWSEVGSRPPRTYAARFGLDGTALDGDGVLLAAIDTRFQVPMDAGAAALGSRLFFTWRETYSNLGARVVVEPWDADLAGAAGPRTVLAPRAAAQTTPRIAVAGSIALVVFHDTRLGDDPKGSGGLVPGLYARRVRTSDGALLDSQAIPIATAPGQRSDFAVAANTDTFLVAYMPDASTFRAVRIRASDGAVLDPGGFLLASASGLREEPAIASDGTSFFVAWTDHRNPSVTQTGNNPDLYGTTVSKDGVVGNTSGTAIDTGLEHALAPALVWTGSEYLLAFRHWAPTASQSGYDVSMRRVSKSGSAGSRSTLVAAADGFDVAFGASRLVLVYRTGGAVRAAWFDANGSTVGSPLDVGTTDPVGPAPSVAWDGAGFLASWLHPTSSTSIDVQGRRLTTSGTLVDAAAAALVPGLRTESGMTSDVERLGTSRYLLAYTRFDATPGTSNLRVFARIVNAAAPSTSSDAGAGGGSGGGNVPGLACATRPARSSEPSAIVVGLVIAVAIGWRRRRRVAVR